MKDHEVVDEDFVHPAPRLEAVEVVLSGLRLDVLRLVREVIARGMDALALCVEHPRHRILGEPVDLKAVDQLAQLARDGHVALGVTEADRRRDVEGALAPVRPVDRGIAQRRRLDELAQRQVDLHRLARLGKVPAVLHRLEPAARDLRQRLSVRIRRDAVLGPVDDEHRAPDPLGELDLLPPGHGRRKPTDCARGKPRPVGVVGPRYGVLDLLGRVRLGEHALRPPLDEVSVAAVGPVVGIDLAPAARRQGALLRERSHARVVQQAPMERAHPAHREHRSDEHQAGDALGVVAGEQEGALGAPRQRDAHGAVDAAGVHHVDRILRELRLRVRRRVGGAVGAPIAARVEADDPEMTSEVGDLRLPHARVD